jgi:uncharacterized protein
LLHLHHEKERCVIAVVVETSDLGPVASDSPPCFGTRTPKSKMKSDNKDGYEFCGSSSSGNSTCLVDPPGAAVLALHVAATTAEEQLQHTNCSTDKDKQECVSGTSSSVSIGKNELAGENEETQSQGNDSSSSVNDVALDATLLQRPGHEKRRTLGRSARRRRRKFLDIQQRKEEIRQEYMQQKKQQQQQQPQLATVGNLTEISFSKKKEFCSIPVDRDKVWPAVAERRRQFAAAAEHVEFDDCGWRGPVDERLLIGQLGFLPGNAIRVSTRVKDLRKKGPDEAVQQQQQQQDADFCQSIERLLLASSSCKKRNSSNNSQSNNSNDYDIVLDHDDGQVPVVLQLYPLVYRDEYTGGRADGRKVAKGRKRRLARKGPNDDGDSDEISIRGDDGKDHDGSEDAPSNSQIILVATDSLSSNIDTETVDVVVEPFPTIYWLTHPLLRVWISQLELDGLGVRLQQRLAAPGNEALLERMKRAHEAYAMERVQLLTPADVALVEARHWEDALLTTSRGVAGVRNPRAVKCLHAHAAHYLSGAASNGSSDNVVGEWVMQEVHRMLKERSKRENGKN